MLLLRATTNFRFLRLLQPHIFLNSSLSSSKPPTTQPQQQQQQQWKLLSHLQFKAKVLLHEMQEKAHNQKINNNTARINNKRKDIEDGNTQAEGSLKMVDLKDGGHTFSGLHEVEEVLKKGQEAVLQYCSELDSKMKQQFYLTLEQIQSLKNLLFQLKKLKKQPTAYPNISKNFLLNYRRNFYSSSIKVIKFQRTVPSIQQSLEYLSVIMNLTLFQSYNNLVKDFVYCTNRCLEKIDPGELVHGLGHGVEGILQVLEELSRRILIFLEGGGFLANQLLSLLAEFDKAGRLTQTDRIRIYAAINGNSICSPNNHNLNHFIISNRQIVWGLTSKSTEAQTLLQIIRYFPNYGCLFFQPYLNKAANYFMQLYRITDPLNEQQYKLLFRFLLTLDQNKQTYRIFRSKQSELVEKYLFDYIKIGKVEDEKIYQLFLKVIYSHSICRTFYSKSKQAILNHSTMKQSLDLAFAFANQGVVLTEFSEAQWFKDGFGEDFMDPHKSVQGKLLDIKKVVYYSYYCENTKTDFPEPILQKIQALNEMTTFIAFFSNLQPSRQITYHFHKIFSVHYMQALIPQLNSQNIKNFIIYCLGNCCYSEFQKLCQVFKEFINHKLLWYLMIKYAYKNSHHYVLTHMLLLVQSYQHSYDNVNINKSSIVDLLVFLSDPSVIRTISMRMVPKFSKFLKLVVTQQYQKKSIQIYIRNFVILFLSRQYKIANSTQMLELVQSFAQNKLHKLNSRYLQHAILFRCIQNNLLNKKILKRIQEIGFGLYDKFLQKLLQLIKTNSEGREVVIITEEDARRNLLLVFKHQRMKEDNLRRLEKFVLSQIQRFEFKSILPLFCSFSLPRMTDSYELVFLTALIKRINKQALHMIFTNIYQIINCMSNLATTYPPKPAYQLMDQQEQVQKSEQTVQVQTQVQSTPSAQLQLKRTQEFQTQMRKLLLKLCKLLIGQNKGQKNDSINNINFEGFHQLIDLMYLYGLCNTKYNTNLASLLSQMKSSSDIYLYGLLMKLTKCCVIPQSKYINNFRQYQIPADLCNQYLYQLLFMHNKTNIQDQFINHLIKTTTITDPLAVKYIQKTHPDMYLQLKQAPTQTTCIAVGKSQTIFNLLKADVLQWHKKRTVEVWEFCSNMRFVLVKSQKKSARFPKLYGFASDGSGRVSVTLEKALKFLLSSVYHIKEQNIYLCAQSKAEYILGANSSQTQPKTKKLNFQQACRDKKQQLDQNELQ